MWTRSCKFKNSHFPLNSKGFCLGKNKSKTLPKYKKLSRELLACSKTDVWIWRSFICITLQDEIFELRETRFWGSNFVLYVSGENWKRRQLSWRLSYIMRWGRRENGMRQWWPCLHFQLRNEDAQLRVRVKKKKLERLILILLNLALISIWNRSQKRNIQAVAAEKCAKKIDRCRKSTESTCKQISKKFSSIFGNKNDEICGTDSKTYNNECELARATCL